MKQFCAILVLLLSFITAFSQGGKMDLESYNPVSSLVVPVHITTRAKFPFIDVHNHQNLATMDLSTLTREMDRMNMAVMVNLSGQGGDRLKKSVQNVRANSPNRFILFTNINFNGVGEKGWEEKTVQLLREDVKNGASGLKIFKNLGFSVKDNNGKRVAVDDPRLDAIWRTCGELKIPVLIHTADPKSFWDPLNATNERWMEITSHPNRRRGADNPVPFDQLIGEQHNMFRRHPGTTFIAAHFGWYPNDLEKLGKLLDEMSHVHVEFGAVIAELGRQPRMAKRFFEKYQDRIMFGKDAWVPEEYNTYFRVLETEDEYFPYHKKYHAFWSMYGIGLPDNILKKVYYKNALRIIPGIDQSAFPD
jgi:predicted TIM-barrel fold metal-dependent hydrolase